jgi:hypothetical protein
MAERRRNRRRRLGRRKPFRDPKPTILIVCEGERTEPQYLRGFRRACRNPRVEIAVSADHGVPMTLVRIAKQRKLDSEAAAKREGDDNLAFDAVWCVFDVDEHPEVANAKAMARDNGIGLAVSNPCFELWLLLHFREQPGMQDRRRVHELLAQFVPDYRKHVEFSIHCGGYRQAVERAEKLNDAADDAGEIGRNPTTNVYPLTESIRGDSVFPS